MFVNTRYFSPVVLGGITRAEHGSYEWYDWWNEQKRRCIEGYSVGGVYITGRHYWYLNWWWIRGKMVGRSGKVLMHPRFLDIDYDYWLARERSIKEKKDLAVLKRRQSGNSNKSSADAGYEVAFFPDSQTVIISGEKKYAKNTFGMFKRGMNELKDTEFYKNFLPDASDHVEAAYREIGEGRSIVKGYRSTCQYMVSDGDPQALIGLSPSLVIYEEIGKFKHFTDVKGYIDPAMENEGEKTGWNVLFGTGGESDASIDELTDLFYNPAKYNILEFDAHEEDDPGLDITSKKGRGVQKTAMFIPAYRYHIVDEDGNSLKEESKKDLIEQRIKKEGDDKKWLTFVTQMPFTPEEALLVPAGNRFNVKKLREQRVRIFKSLGPDGDVQIGDLEWDYDQEKRRKPRPLWHPNKATGKYRIIEHPDEDPSGKVYKRLYVAGTDSYDKDKTASIHGSFGSMFVYKRFLDADHSHDMFVASLTERPETSEEFYEDTAKLCAYFGYCENLVEYSNLRIFDWYENNGFLGLLKDRPMVAYANTINSQMQNKYGIDASTKPYWIQSMADYVEKYSQFIYDPDFLDALINYRDNDPDYNCDKTIASSLALVHNHDNLRIAVKKDEPPKRRFHMGRYVVIGGQMRKVFA